MIPTGIRFSVFQSDQASENDWVAFTTFRNHLMAEILPEDPPLILEEIRRSWNSIPPVVERKAWSLSSGTENTWLVFGYMDTYLQGTNTWLNFKSGST
jgi:hypothetical protein